MISHHFSGVAVARAAAVMSWTLHVAGSAAPAAHPTAATRDAITATKRRAAAAPVASVKWGLI